MYTPIRDYALIGNRRSAVLVSKHGSIDWAPAPFVDSPTVFAALLDEARGGFWSIRPCENYRVRQYYIEETNILVTEFTTARGVWDVTDFLPLEKERHYVPPEEDTTFKIKRRVTCRKGECTIAVRFAPRFDYARGTTRLYKIAGGVRAEHGHMRGVLVSGQEFSVAEGVAECVFSLKAGRDEFFVFRYNTGEVDLMKDNYEHHERELNETIQKHRRWCRTCETGTCALPERWRDALIRSKLVLKALFFEPVGTIAAAPTTSLPEWIGGARNWDYRFTWLRDSSFLLESFFKLGHVTEAERYLNWLVNICTMEGPEHLKIMYGLRGEVDLHEERLNHLSGYRNSRPVRIGNAAHDQKQWDVYGSVLNVAYTLHRLSGNSIDRHRWRVLRDLADYVCVIWREPDEGLWEVRGGKKRFTYSALMNWVALDRAIRLAEHFGFEGDTDTWRAERRRIREAICREGWSARKQSFTQALGEEDLDAALLLMPVMGFLKGDDPKMKATVRAIERELVCGEDGVLVRRYTSFDGMEEEEGAFLLSSFWYVDALALAGELPRAVSVFETLLSYANHVGLYAEEMHPRTKEFLGNFPQAYTHIGLINSAFLLDRLLRERSTKGGEASPAAHQE